ncbi:hypothetical protein F7725_026273 [Dissostichus mawsoni]|uniref:Uncharacterized protein n=1 Tax=Dissostichus mawsoni TaxID=36200 RepID=A0A7J5X829_DISMA|nr:hypothetical protein F7725_026273 [Dissostichus mawsoni]
MVHSFQHYNSNRIQDLIHPVEALCVLDGDVKFLPQLLKRLIGRQSFTSTSPSPHMSSCGGQDDSDDNLCAARLQFMLSTHSRAFSRSALFTERMRRYESSRTAFRLIFISKRFGIFCNNLPAEGRDQMGRVRVASSPAQESSAWDHPARRKTNRVFHWERCGPPNRPAGRQSPERPRGSGSAEETLQETRGVRAGSRSDEHLHQSVLQLGPRLVPRLGPRLVPLLGLPGSSVQQILYGEVRKNCDYKSCRQPRRGIRPIAEQNMTHRLVGAQLASCGRRNKGVSQIFTKWEELLRAVGWR